MQSSTASGPGNYSGQFAALRHLTSRMSLPSAVMPDERCAANEDDAVGEPFTGLFAGPFTEPFAEPVAVTGVAEGAGLAHDAANLLGALSLYSDLLALPGVLHLEHKEYATELKMLSDRSWAMIDRLVNHARAGRPTKVQGEVSVLPDVVDRCRGLLSRVAGRTVDTSYGVGAFEPVRVPVESVERILTNLVKNAAEATPWVGPISIHVESVKVHAEGEGHAPRRRVVMTVRDRGCGMDQAVVKRLLQSGGASTGDRRGLGFRVVRELVAASEGSLQIESQQGAGTSVSAGWLSVTEHERSVRQSVRQEEMRVMMAAEKTVVRGEAGWIAC